ncbi:GMP synthase [glutamine-hydrolyzing] amidotransferase / ATP pyrophosphatase subunit [Vibrio astriarenae]|nr:GMP synthase [glutamine-hydrolyzing] amidotransferase / ATP pyrophosphatase subunit [Vibrio sp. C7]
MTKNIHDQRILILDFGSQYTQLVARRVREIGVYCELWSWDVEEADIREFNPDGIILSGGPESVTEENSPRAPQYVFDSGVPVLGVCYGMQTMAEQLGGKVASSDEREFGYAQVSVSGESAIFKDLEATQDVWMSTVTRLSRSQRISLKLARQKRVHTQRWRTKRRNTTAFNSTQK